MHHLHEKTFKIAVPNAFCIKLIMFLTLKCLRTHATNNFMESNS